MYVVQPPSSPAILLHEKDDLCSLVKYPSKSRERHLQKISLDERYVSRSLVMLFFIFFQCLPKCNSLPNALFSPFDFMLRRFIQKQGTCLDTKST